MKNRLLATKACTGIILGNFIDNDEVVVVMENEIFGEAFLERSKGVLVMADTVIVPCRVVTVDILVPLSTRCTVVYPDGCAGIDAVCIGEVIIPKGRVILSILIANTIVLKPPAASDVTVEREAAEPDEMVVHMLLE